MQSLSSSIMIEHCISDTACPTNIYDLIFIRLEFTEAMYQTFCIAFVEVSRNKHDAKDICIDNDGKLIEVKDENMQMFLENELTQRVLDGDLVEAFWWIGITADSLIAPSRIEITADSVKTWLWTDGNYAYCPSIENKVLKVNAVKYYL